MRKKKKFLVHGSRSYQSPEYPTETHNDYRENLLSSGSLNQIKIKSFIDLTAHKKLAICDLGIQGVYQQ